MKKKRRKKRRRFWWINRIFVIMLLSIVGEFLLIILYTNVVLPEKYKEFYVRDEKYIKTDNIPMTYIVMLDNSISMKKSFKNMDSQLKDCLFVYQSILKKNDKLVVFPLNYENNSYIEISGKDEYIKGQENLNSIKLFEQEVEESVELWTERVVKYMAQLEQTETRVLVITDKAEKELNPLKSIKIKKDRVRVLTTRLHLLSENKGDLLFKKVIDANDFVVSVFNSEFYMNYQGLYFCELKGKSTSIELNLPEETDRLTVLLLGENNSLNWLYSDPVKGKESMEGKILSDSMCLYHYQAEKDIKEIKLFLSGAGTVYVLYPTLNGDEAIRIKDDFLERDLFIALIVLVVLWLSIHGCIAIYEKRSKYKKKIFISYRREGSATLAHAIAERLRNGQHTTYLDTESLKAEKFNKKLLDEIKESSCVVVVIPPGGLNRCLNNKEDWIRQEISWAIYNNIPIIPVLIRGFQWPDELPLDISGLETCNAIIFDEKNYYQESMEKVVEFVEYVLNGEVLDSSKNKDPLERFLELIRLDEEVDKLKEKNKKKE